MNAARSCARCQRELPSEAGLTGICPVCAFAFALEPTPDERSGATSRPGALEPSQSIGPYRLLERIGEGGMGEVWLAEQVEPVKRRVALKVVKPGMDTHQVIARFEAERQALAMMDHPSISKVLDAGSTETGQPFFVMDYVDGLPITEHCDQRELTTRERLELFLQVCDAVQHAHQKAIIHRDLKPSNVLVSMQDGVAVPKVIDFGVAKAMAQPLTEKTLFTEIGMLIGTPEYMSPEQANLTVGDVDTRTDVYALGVLLYELVVGALPFEPQSLREAGFEGVCRMIREVEPPKPSARLTTLGKGRATESARHRRSDLPALRRQLKGELDWITMKAIEKERARRYGSPSELAADIQRHLNHEPVLAGPPSAVYRARKFARRHRFGVAAAAVAVFALIGFAGAMIVQTSRIAREAESKRRVSQFMSGLFEVSNPSEARGNSITARELLDKGVAKIGKELSGDPDVRGELMATMGMVYVNLGLYRQAEPLLKEGLETRRRVLGSHNPETLRLANELGRLYQSAQRDKEAEAILLDTLHAQTRVLGPEHPDRLKTMGNLGRALWGQGRSKEAEVLFREELAIQKRVLGPEHIETLRSMHGLGLAVKHQGRLGEAETIFKETLALRKRVLGPDHPHTLNSMMHLGLCYSDQNRPRDAEAVYREMIPIVKRVLGPRHPDAVWASYNMAGWLANTGQREEALAYLRDAVDNGLDETKYLVESPDFAPFLKDPEFKKIVAASDANHARASSAK